MLIYYFGCWNQVGHYLRDTDGKDISIFNNDLPWKRIDGTLCPDSTRKQGVAEIHHKKGWTALAFWDYSIDERPGSNSVFFYQNLLEFDEMVSEFKEHFPKIVSRFDFPIIELYQ